MSDLYQDFTLQNPELSEHHNNLWAEFIDQHPDDFDSDENTELWNEQVAQDQKMQLFFEKWHAFQREATEMESYISMPPEHTDALEFRDDNLRMEEKSVLDIEEFECNIQWDDIAQSHQKQNPSISDFLTQHQLEDVHHCWIEMHNCQKTYQEAQQKYLENKDKILKV